MNLREKRPRGKVLARREVLENLKKARSGGGRTELHEVCTQSNRYYLQNTVDLMKSNICSAEGRR